MDAQTIAENNTRTFIHYRVFFRARYYYPVFTLLFLDFGLSLSQFAILNSIWALTIVLFEIPLGGLADTIGRRKIVITSAILLNLELLVWLFAPINGGDTLFYFFLVNRIISGLCEAASSGADEALAYDALEKAQLKDKWAEVLEKTQRYTSLYFMFVLLVGASVYDPSIMNSIYSFFGGTDLLTQSDTLKFPILLNQLAAIYVLFNAFKFKENWEPKQSIRQSIRSSGIKIIQSINWIKKTVIVISLLLILTFSESLILQFLTLMQQYWKVIDIPIFYYGIIGSILALFASMIPSLGKFIHARFSLKTNFTICYLCIVAAYSFIAFSIPLYGIMPVVLLYCAYQLVIYLNSVYLNTHCLEENRATVLSIQSMLSFSKYGVVSMLYSFLVTAISNKQIYPNLDQTFKISLVAFPIYFIATTAGIYFLARNFYKRRISKHNQAAEQVIS